MFKKHLTINKRHNPFALADNHFANVRPGSRYRNECTAENMVEGRTGGLHLGRTFNANNVWSIKIILVVCFLILVGRIFWLQVANGAYYRDLSDGNRIRIKRIEAKRGIIYDKDLNPLVQNAANFLLYFIPADLPTDVLERQVTLSRLSNILGNVSVAEMETKLREIKPKSFEAFQPLPIVENVDYDKAMLIYLEASKMRGVVLSNQSRRQYFLPTLSYSNVLGYTGKINAEELAKAGQEYSPIDYIGKTGVETFYENELKGVNGRQQVEVDALGQEKKIISQSRVKDGNNLVLSIDSLAQVKLEEIMRATLTKFGMSRGVAIAMNPNNGEIISLVSLPTYNNNDFARGISQEEYSYLANHPDKPLFFRAVNGEYPSGSTIKMVVLSGALEEGIVNENTQFLSNGGLRITDWFFPDWKAGGHGMTNARKAIAESVNTYFYYIGGGYQDFVGLGIDRMDKYFKMFGLGEQTGIDLPGEANGFIPTKEWKESTKKENWYIGDTYHVAIGQGDLIVTPLQVANYTTYFANGGNMYRPHVVKYVLSGEDKLISATDVTPARSNVISAETLKVVREGMRQGVTSGSSRRLDALPVAAAGKTGTAQWSTEKKPHAWFTGFAPYDKPEIVLTVLIEEGEEGSVTAMNVAWEFLNWYFSQKNI
jgi:penicillin-binding protein 2